MIIFKTIKFKNFGSFGNTFTQINLNKNSKTLICGNNGSGKSFAFLDSITYALFGKPFRKINIPQLTNSINSKNCIVEIEFQKGTDEYKIRRGLNPKIFEIYKNSELINQDSNSLDYQKILEESILRMNYKTFTQVVILGSSSFVPFMQLNVADRRQVIENILDIDVFSSMNILLKGKLMQLKETIKCVSSKIEIQEAKKETQKNYVETLEREEQSKEIEFKTELERLESQRDLLLTEFHDLDEKIKTHKDEITEKDFIKQQLQRVRDLHIKFKNNIAVAKKNIDFYNKNNSCPMCSQTIEHEFKLNEIKRNEEKHFKLEKTLTDLMCEETKIIQLHDKISKTIDTITNLQILQGKKESVIDSIQTQLQTLSSKKKQKENQKNLLYQEKLKLDNICKEIETLEKQKKELTEDVVYDECIYSLLKDSGVKSKIIKYYLPHINNYINKFLRSMDFFVQFNLDENFNEQIKSRNRDEFSYENFSEGEKMRIDLSLLLAWREVAKAKNSVNCNLLIMDEVFDSSLDSIGMEELMKLIKTLDTSANIYIISHKADQLVDKFEHIVSFEKKQNFSKMISN
jgi:DNA repair exonuclease SbcCD ATPase subunit